MFPPQFHNSIIYAPVINAYHLERITIRDRIKDFIYTLKKLRHTPAFIIKRNDQRYLFQLLFTIIYLSLGKHKN